MTPYWVDVVGFHNSMAYHIDTNNIVPCCSYCSCYICKSDVPVQEKETGLYYHILCIRELLLGEKN